MATKKHKLVLSPELEKALVAGLIHGIVSPEAVNQEELSDNGRKVYRAVTDMLLSGAAPPLAIQAILLNLTEVQGAHKGQAQIYLESVKASIPSAEGAEATVRKLREKQTLLAVMNTASGQLQKGEFQADQITEVLAGTSSTKAPVPLAEIIKEGLPPPPARLQLRSLPKFSARIGGGLVGLTVLAGEPAVGKSRVAWQVALDLSSQGTTVVYYDLDNGFPILMDRTSKMFGGNHNKVVEATKNIYLRDSIRTLDSDLVYIPAPALVVVDIFQALPTPSEFERQGLAHWIHRLGALRRRGYHILVVSEVPRTHYGIPSIGAFKGSGEIEYTADLGLQMIPYGDGAQVHIVKNRLGDLKGECVTLTTEHSVVWKEVGDQLETELEFPSSPHVQPVAAVELDQGFPTTETKPSRLPF